MHAQKPTDKSTERRWMQEAQQERHEREQSLPVEQRHADPDWLAAFWKRLAAS